MKHLILKILAFSFLVIFSFSCDEKQDDPVFSSDIELNLFTVPDFFYSPNPQLKATLRANEDLHMAFFGYDAQLTSVILTDETTAAETVVLLDQEGNPAFLYQIESRSGIKKEALVEFVPESSGGFLMRFYHYKWDERIGTLLMEQKVISSGDDWDVQTTFTTSNPNLNGVNARLGKGSTFYSPLPRLDKLGMRIEKNLESEDLIADFMQQIDDFRQNDISTFLRDKVAKVGIAGAIVGGLGVLAGSPAAGVVLIGGTGLVTVSYGIDFFMNEGWEKLRDEFNEVRSTIVQGRNSLRNGIVEVVDSYVQKVSDYWSDLNFDTDNLEDLLIDFDEEELISSNENLDDLPDDEGVVHISLSWDNYSDMDLWVIDPSGFKIFFEAPASSTGGYLDRDDVDGFGPENIYWRNGAPDGNYSVVVHYYGCETQTCSPATIKVVVSNGLGTIKNYEGTLYQEDDRLSVVTFTKQGKQLLF